MTIFESPVAPSYQSGPISPRTILPRTPTPWRSRTPPEDGSPTPISFQVEQILQTVSGGSPYRTYQPFRVEHPLVESMHTNVGGTFNSENVLSGWQNIDNLNPTKNSENNSDRVSDIEPTENANNNCDSDSHSNATSLINSQMVARSISIYSSQHYPEKEPQPTGREPPPLIRMCRSRLVSHFGLRRLKLYLEHLGAPPTLVRYLSTFDTTEFVVK